MAALRTPSAPSADAIVNRTASKRVSFAKIYEPLEVPDLLGLQVESFDWLLGNERWQSRVAAAKAQGRKDPAVAIHVLPSLSLAGLSQGVFEIMDAHQTSLVQTTLPGRA